MVPIKIFVGLYIWYRIKSSARAIALEFIKTELSKLTWKTLVSHYSCVEIFYSD